MIKTIEETGRFYDLTEVDGDFTFEDEDGNEIFSGQWNVPNVQVGKDWPVEGILFGKFGNNRSRKPVRDERVINQVRDQIEKWSPHDEELAEKVLESLDKKDEFGSLFDLPDETEAYFKNKGEKLVLFYDGEDFIDPDKNILWPANSINVTVLLYWIGDEEVQKRLWHKQKDKPRFPDRKPKWTGREVLDLDSSESVKSYGEDVANTFSGGTYRCVGLQKE